MLQTWITGFLPLKNLILFFLFLFHQLHHCRHRRHRRHHRHSGHLYRHRHGPCQKTTTRTALHLAAV